MRRRRQRQDQGSRVLHPLDARRAVPADVRRAVWCADSQFFSAHVLRKAPELRLAVHSLAVPASNVADRIPPLPDAWVSRDVREWE